MNPEGARSVDVSARARALLAARTFTRACRAQCSYVYILETFILEVFLVHLPGTRERQSVNRNYFRYLKTVTWSVY